MSLGPTALGHRVRPRSWPRTSEKNWNVLFVSPEQAQRALEQAQRAAEDLPAEQDE